MKQHFHDRSAPFFCNKCKRYDGILEYKPLIINPKIAERFMSTNKPGETHAAASTGGGEEFKDQSIKYVLSKFEHDLYHEEDDVTNPVIRVKRMSMPNKGEKWKVMNDNKIIFVIESPKMSKKEREFLQTVEGFNFILSQAKQGIKSLNSFKIELKKVIDKDEEPVSKKPKQKSSAKNKSKKRRLTS